MSKSAVPRKPAKTAHEQAEGRKAERLAVALRDNLKRRKAQQRARDEAGPDEPTDGSGNVGAT